jgi:triacylglycerol lipase
VEKSNNYRLAVDCIAGCSLEYTRYPIFFMHGLAGFDSLLNVMDYWLGVDELLTNTGYHVEIHGVPAFDTTYVRTGYWQEYLQELVDTGVGRKFNLIGHSQGGLDARYFASVLDTENRVASITTIATPHTGSSVAELLSMGMDISPDNGA